MSGAVKVFVSCFLVLQFSLLSAVDVWAMTLPMDSMSHGMTAPEAKKMGMAHCQSGDQSEAVKQCQCSSCACIPLVIGTMLQPALPHVAFDQSFSRRSVHFYRVPLVPPFRAPIV